MFSYFQDMLVVQIQQFDNLKNTFSGTVELLIESSVAFTQSSAYVIIITNLTLLLQSSLYGAVTQW